MKKVFELKVGDTAIYTYDYNVKVSTVVSKPIDDGKTRPRFKIGRKDLANGDYLVNGGTVYDTVQEAEEHLIEALKSEIKKYEEEKEMADVMIKVLNVRLESLQNHQ